MKGEFRFLNSNFVHVARYFFMGVSVFKFVLPFLKKVTSYSVICVQNRSVVNELNFILLISLKI